MSQHCRIVVVEPDELHFAFLSHVVEHKKLGSQVTFCRNGHSTISYLSSATKEARTQLHACILELSLPDIHGAELVDLLRNLEHLQHIQFVIFSKFIGSLAEKHVRMLNGCRMVHKPPSTLELQEQFCTILQSLNTETKMVSEVICSSSSAEVSGNDIWGASIQASQKTPR